jgi:hypothetical protein
METQLERIAFLQRNITTSQAQDIYKMSGRNDITDALQKFAEPFEESSFENVRQDKIEEIARNWGISEYEVSEKLSEIANILRARLVETVTDPTEESADELKQVLEHLDLISAQDLKVGEIDKILNYVTKMDEQTYYFSKILGNLMNIQNEGIGIDISKGYEYKPESIPSESLTMRERMALGRYKKAELKKKFVKVDEAEALAAGFEQTQDPAYAQEFLDKLRSKLDGKKVSVARIIDPKLATAFFEQIMDSDLFTQAYKDILSLIVSEAPTTLELSINDKSDLESFVEELMADIKDNETKRYIEKWAKMKMREFEDEPDDSFISATIPIIPPSKYKPRARQSIAEAKEDPDYASAFGAAKSRGLEHISLILENSRMAIAGAEDGIKMIVSELGKLPDKADVSEIKRAIRKVGEDIKEIDSNRDTSIRGNVR